MKRGADSTSLVIFPKRVSRTGETAVFAKISFDWKTPCGTSIIQGTQSIKEMQHHK